MHDQSKILEQGIQVGTVGRRQWQQALEGIAGQKQKAQEAGVQQPHHPQHPGKDVLGQCRAPQGNGAHPQRHDEGPQQQRALMGAPNGTDLVLPRQQAVGIARHVGNREVIGDEGVDQHQEAQRHEHQLSVCGRDRRVHPASLAEMGAAQTKSRPRHAQGKR